MRALLLVALAACSGKPVQWESDAATAVARARREHADLLVEVYASWSMPSVQLDRQLHDADLARCVPLRIDVTEGDDRSEAIARRYAGTATLAIESPDGTLIAQLPSPPAEPELRAFLRSCR